MEQAIVIIALVIYWIFRGVSRSQPRIPGGGVEGGPVTRGGLENTIEEAQERALEALQRWEAKQRATGRPAKEPGADVWRRPIPETSPESAPRVRIASRRAEKQRQDAYADIAGMLDPAAAPVEIARGRGRLRVRTPRAAASRKWTEGADRESRALESPEPAAERRRPATSDPAGREPQFTAARPSEVPPVAPRRAGSRRSGRARPGAALQRLERFPLGARAIAYAEILGRPPGLR